MHLHRWQHMQHHRWQHMHHHRWQHRSYRRRRGGVGPTLLHVLRPVAHGLRLVEHQFTRAGHVVSHAALAQVVVLAVQRVAVIGDVIVAVLTRHWFGVADCEG